MIVVSEKEDFIKKANEFPDGVICIGAGKNAHTLEKVFGLEFLEKIVVFVDRDIRIQEEGIIIGGKKKKVISYRGANEYVKGRNVILLITAVDYIGINEELKKFTNLALKETHCLIFINGYEQEKEDLLQKIPDNLSIYSTRQIPKIIHYCWFGGSPIPEKNLIWMQSWRKYCPDYEIIRWDESNYDIRKAKYVSEAYDSKKWAFVSDYVRLDVVYNNGGLYFDVDVEIVKNFDDMLFQDAFVAFETPYRVATGLGFGGKKGNKVIGEMLDYYNNISFINDSGVMDLTPCPIHQTRVLEKRGLIKNGAYQILDGITVFPEKMLTGKSASTKRIMLTDYTKAIHHYDASWQTEVYKNSSKLLELDFERKNCNY
ncbi:glycosyltransferase family 32 protein [Pseudobutyrivibrio ruminis]|uniref:glycosyltransferase family 32 protein n=1 Tax=Pseudobutyrivibrio ruminis TaxID=46206 RepID=UPI0003F5EBCA|nr:glycosyltransferase [Pseudobutyrivibrio ruminis]